MNTNEQAWLNWLIANADNLPDFTAAQAALSGVIGTGADFGEPDANGNVLLLTVPEWKNWPMHIAEVDAELEGDALAIATENLNEANGKYYPYTPRADIGACYPASVVVNGTATLDIAHPIIGSTSWPGKIALDGVCDLGTKAGVAAWCRKTPRPGPHGDNTFPHPPGG